MHINIEPRNAIAALRMRHSSRLAAAIAGVLVAAASVDAQPLDYGSMEQLFGEPVTMSVTGAPQRVSEAAATMTIITAEDIRRSGARDVTGVLRHVVGLDLLQTSNDHADVAARGYNQSFSPRLLVLVDGRQVYADYYGFTPWATVPVELEAIRQIEVVKGPNSALFGFNAAGGVINIVTYSPVYDSVDRATVRAGSQGLAAASAVTTWKIGAASGVRVSAGRRSNDDFSTPLGPADAGARRGNERNAINVDSDFALTDRLTLGVEGTYSDAQHAELGPVYAMGHTQYETRSLKAHVSAETQIGLVEGTVYENAMRSFIYTGTAPGAFLTFDNDVAVAKVRVISKVAGAHTLRWGLEHRENSLLTTPLPGGEVLYDIDAVDGMWEWPIAARLTLTSAVRWDQWSLGRRGVLPPGYGFSNADWDRSRTERSINAGAIWQVTEVDTLRLIAGRGVQIPSLMNLGGFLLPIDGLGYFSGVPDLEPTIVHNYEMSWDRATPIGTLRVAAFRGRTRAVTAATGGARLGGTLLTPANIGDSHTTGVELSIEARLGEHWRWGAGATYQRINDHFDVPVQMTFTDFENTTPKLIALGKVGWSSGSWELDGFVRYQSSFHGVIADGIGISGLLTPIGSYVALDGRAAYSLNERMTLSISGQNLNRSEQRQTAAPRVERQLLATFAVSF